MTDPFLDRAADRAIAREVGALVMILAGLVGVVAVAGHYYGGWGILAVLSVVLLAAGITLASTR